MISFLETPDARLEAEKMTSAIIDSGSISFPPSAEYPASCLKEETMLSVLIAKPKSSNEVKILRGFSGSIGELYTVPGYVQPCFSVSERKRIIAQNDERIHELTERIDNGEDELKSEREKLTNESISSLSSLYRFRCWDGKDIGLPEKAPWGTGDCAGLKCINTALRKNWEIIGLAEFRIKNGRPEFHAPCEARCGLLLPSMLGLDFIYADSSIAVINKKEGMLSVPGRGEDKKDSASFRFHTLFPSSPAECNCHRLDMDTSGLLACSCFHKRCKTYAFNGF